MSKRNLYLTNIPVQEAIKRFQNALCPFLKTVRESVGTARALDRITDEAVFARCNSPLFDCAAMDGIAVISGRTHGASETSPLLLRPDEDFVMVDTGNPVRHPYDAVIMAEDIQEAEDGTVLIRSAVPAWQHVRPVGEDIAEGEMILPGNHRIRPIDIGMLLSGGITSINVRRRPTVAVIPTGTEIVEPGVVPKEGNIIESNSYMFEALITKGGGIPTRFAPIPDDYEQIKERLRSAAESFDMVIINAGTSAGRKDYTVHVLRELGEVIVHGVAIKPGKPVILAMVNGKPVIGIPGYPVSAYISYENFAAPILRSLSGHFSESMPVVSATLTRRLVSSLKYKEYVRVKVGRVGGRIVATPLSRGAGVAMSLVRADGFCVIEQDVEGVEAGSSISVELCRDSDSLESTVVSIGSHDLILDVIADMLPNLYPNTHLSSTHVGSIGGLLALKKGEAHIAPLHLLDEETGEYNIPDIKKLFAGQRMALIKGVGRVQGIMVKRGNPLHISRIEDLSRCRYVNRQRGAGTRVLFDYKLKSAGIEPAEIAGYEREAATHMAVAAAVRGESADAGMGVFSAAKSMGLDFIPVGDEEYDFAVLAEHLELPHVRAFIEILKNPRFIKKLAEMGGYSAKRCGEIVLIDNEL